MTLFENEKSREPASKVTRILVLEDLPTDAELTIREVRRVLSGCEFHRVETREDFAQALHSFKPHVILSDFRLPQFDGMEALEIAKSFDLLIPFIIITGSQNEDTAVACMKAGAWDYVIKEHIKRLGPAVISALEQKRLRIEQRLAAEKSRRWERVFEEAQFGLDHAGTSDNTFLEVNPTFARERGYQPQELQGRSLFDIYPPEEWASFLEMTKALLDKEHLVYETVHVRKDGSTFPVLMELTVIRDEQGNPVSRITYSLDITGRKAAEKHLQDAMERVHRAMKAVSGVIVKAVEYRDPYTAGHQNRVSDLARAIATEMGFSADRVEGIRIAGLIHDLGKISVPAEILSMPRQLNEIEYALVKTHAQKGFEILKEVDFDWPVAEMVYQHHERLDGSGYPRGLKGDEWIMEARIIAVADVVEAMASHRPYRAGLGIEAALNEIVEQRGILYDAKTVDVCVRLFRDKQFTLLDLR